MVKIHLSIPSQEFLRGIHSYDPDSGRYLHSVDLNTRKKGDHVGIIKEGGPIHNRRKFWGGAYINGGSYVVARLIWVWVTGDDPGELLVDHENRNSLDNRWTNLRLATHGENSRNRSIHRNNSTGYANIYYVSGGRYRVSFQYEGQPIDLGTFPSLNKAKKALKVKKELYGEFYPKSSSLIMV
tara:strand:- start:1051 stop:1599 length:549 start_codon:yes stop_codon:yes gene_type:complete